MYSSYLMRIWLASRRIQSVTGSSGLLGTCRPSARLKCAIIVEMIAEEPEVIETILQQAARPVGG